MAFIKRALLYPLLIVGNIVATPSALSQSSPDAHRSLRQETSPAGNHDALIRDIQARVRILAQEVVSFWETRGVDWERGGFFGLHDISGRPDPVADKGLIQQSRHLWTFSTLQKLNFQGRSGDFEPIADQTFTFLTKFYRPEKQFFIFQLNASGTEVRDDTEQFYANAYAMFSLSQYAQVAPPAQREHARQLAMSVFNSLLQKGYDTEFGGFDQTHDPWYFTPEQRQAGLIKDYNTHLHILEAMTALYQLTGDARVQSHLNQLIDIFLDKMIGKRSFIPLVFAKNWSTHGAPLVSYGHDIETIWLIHEAMKVVGRGHEVSAIATLIRVGQHAADKGFDHGRGGFYEEGLYNGSVTKNGKVWWAQAEGLLGLWKLYEWTGDRQYLHQIGQTLDWIEKYQRHPVHGEWYWEVTAEGIPDTSRYNFIGGPWKTSYHSGRALLFLNEWLGR